MLSPMKQWLEKRTYHAIIYIHRMYFRRRFNVLGPMVDCRGLISIRPEFVGETSMVKMEGKEGKSERFRSLRTFIDTTINYYCMCDELLVNYINQKAAPTYHFVVVLLCVSRFVLTRSLKLVFMCTFSLFSHKQFWEGDRIWMDGFWEIQFKYNIRVIIIHIDSNCMWVGSPGAGENIGKVLLVLRRWGGTGGWADVFEEAKLSNLRKMTLRRQGCDCGDEPMDGRTNLLKHVLTSPRLPQMFFRCTECKMLLVVWSIFENSRSPRDQRVTPLSQPGFRNRGRRAFAMPSNQPPSQNALLPLHNINNNNNIRLNL